MEKGRTIWICGLPSSGKSTLASMLSKVLEGNVELLDGDIIRQNLVSLGFEKEQRMQNIKRIRWLCNLLNKYGINVIVAAITPYEEMRKENRENIENYVEIWTYASIDKCKERDVKGLYKKAEMGLVNNMTGIDDPFEHLENPDIICNTEEETKEESLSKIKRYLGMYENVKIHQKHLVNIYNEHIGNNTSVGAFVEIGKNVIIGNNCKIQAFTFIPSGVTIGNNVFVGPRVTFLNDKYPPSRGKHHRKIIVEDYVSVGGGATILPGVTLHEGCRIGAGAVVTKDVGKEKVVVGNPAREMKK